MGNFLTNLTDTGNQVQTQQPQANLQPWLEQAQQAASIIAPEARGGGPNPAQQQYLQNTQQIAQNQANMYSQNRALNPGLAARMSGNTAASMGQQAASQASMQQMMQQLAAQQQLANLSTGVMGGINQASGIGAQIGMGNQAQSADLFSGAMQGLGMGGAFGSGVQNGVTPKKYQGGMISKGYADGGQVSNDNTYIVPDHLQPIMQIYHPQDKQDSSGTEGLFQGAGSALTSLVKTAPAAAAAGSQGGQVSGPKSNPKIDQVPQSDRFSMNADPYHFGQGGKVPAILSPGEEYIPPNKVNQVAQGQEKASHAGKKVPGKAHVKGDSPKNDTVSASLDEGGIVIPRSIFDSENPEKEAQKFVAEALAKHKKSPEGEFKEALKRAVSGRKNK